MTAAFFCLRFSISRVVDRVCLVATTRRSNLQGPLNSKVLIDLRDSAADARRPSVAARFFTGRRIGRVDVGARRRDRGCIITNSFGRQLTTSRHGDILRHCLVLRKRRGAMSRDCTLASKLLLECRIARRFASISRQAAPLRQKPFAIVKRDGEDPPTVAGRPSSHAYFAAGGKG